jgi:hypothetical protein
VRSTPKQLRTPRESIHRNTNRNGFLNFLYIELQVAVAGGDGQSFVRKSAGFASAIWNAAQQTGLIRERDQLPLRIIEFAADALAVCAYSPHGLT